MDIGIVTLKKDALMILDAWGRIANESGIEFSEAVVYGRIVSNV